MFLHGGKNMTNFDSGKIRKVSAASRIYAASPVLSSANTKEKFSNEMDSKSEDKNKDQKQYSDNSDYILGNFIGIPKLSSRAVSFYNKLQQKYPELLFVLVQEKYKEKAKKKSANFARQGIMMILLEEEIVEKMAVNRMYASKIDEILRKSIHSIVPKKTLPKEKVKGYGIQIEKSVSFTLFVILNEEELLEEETKIGKHIDISG